MRLLVLGGTRFVGRAIVEDALARGWDVTTLNRGLTGTPPATVTTLRADRTSGDELVSALADGQWDLAVDTWSGAPCVATAAADALRERVDRFGYVSSMSVYSWGTHVDEDSPLVEADMHAEAGSYDALKRGAELGVLDSFPDALLCRAGLILGPYEDIGRLPWWLTRIAAGGRVVAPGRPQRLLQYVDARDLAAWVLSGLENQVRGAVDVAGPSGLATTSSLLEACVETTASDAELVWISEQTLADAGVEPWTQLPCWVPESGEFEGFLESDTSLAAQTGLVCRAVGTTVRDTWRWLQLEGIPAERPDRPAQGLPADLERRLLGR